MQVATPIMTGFDCEGTGSGTALFNAVPAVTSSQPFFKHDVHLTVSAQLHLEAFCSYAPEMTVCHP